MEGLREKGKMLSHVTERAGSRENLTTDQRQGGDFCRSL